jgi:hypothetical protein
VSHGQKRRFWCTLLRFWNGDDIVYAADIHASGRADLLNDSVGVMRSFCAVRIKLYLTRTGPYGIT